MPEFAFPLNKRKKNILYMYRRNTIKWSLSCDKGNKSREEVFKKLDYDEKIDHYYKS